MDGAGKKDLDEHSTELGLMRERDSAEGVVGRCGHGQLERIRWAHDTAAACRTKQEDDLSTWLLCLLLHAPMA